MTYEEKLSKLIQCETVSKLGQTDLSKFYNCHKLLKELFPNIFAAAAYTDFDGVMLLVWKGKDPLLKPIMFMNHMDVVEANGQWTYPPFSGKIADGKVYGRGSQDTKDGLFAMLQAADELAAEGFVPKQDIYFESTCNEEISGEGADKLSDYFKSQGIELECVYDEGGKVSEDGTLAQVGLSEKGIVELEFVATSEGGHASRPPKNSPLVRLGRFMAAVDDSTDLFPSEFVEETGETEETTIAFTVAKGSEGRNVLPTRASVICSMRCSHHQGVDGSINAVTEFAKKFGVEVNVLFKGLDAPISKWPDARLSAAIESVFPGAKVKPYIMKGATDSLFYSKVCKNIYRFSPVKASEAQIASIHSNDENINIDSLKPAVETFKFLMKA